MSSPDEILKDQLLLQMQSTLEMVIIKFKQEAQQLNGLENLADGQLSLLFSLCRKGTCNASDVANLIGITSGAVTGMTDKLVSMGLIERERSETDRRVVLFTITEKGKETIKRIRNQRLSRITELFRPINNDDLATTINVFNTISQLLDTRKIPRRE